MFKTVPDSKNRMVLGNKQHMLHFTNKDMKIQGLF